MEALKTIIGIDYGGRTAGTTALAALVHHRLTLVSCPKGQDADVWIEKHVLDIQPSIIAIDAPLSLPSGIMGMDGDFHMRLADRLCGAMSPMFLGGLTARAMALKASCTGNGVWIETYPSWIAKTRSGCLRTNHAMVMKWLQKMWPEVNLPSPVDQHQVDALLALSAAEHIYCNTSLHYGDPREGVIVI